MSSYHDTSKGERPFVLPCSMPVGNESLTTQLEHKPDELLLRCVLASELKCWHRLTADEAQNLVHFAQNLEVKLAQTERELVVVHRVLRKTLDGEWKHDGRYWTDGPPSKELVADVAAREGWHIECAYTTPPPRKSVPPSAYESLIRDMTTIAAREVPKGCSVSDFARHALADAELREHDASPKRKSLTWQPMDTAPFNTDLLVLNETGFVSQGYRSKQYATTWTHWMSLPDAPTEAASRTNYERVRR